MRSSGSRVIYNFTPTDLVPKRRSFGRRINYRQPGAFQTCFHSCWFFRSDREKRSTTHASPSSLGRPVFLCLRFLARRGHVQNLRRCTDDPNVHPTPRAAPNTHVPVLPGPRTHATRQQEERGKSLHDTSLQSHRSATDSACQLYILFTATKRLQELGLSRGGHQFEFCRRNHFGFILDQDHSIAVSPTNHWDQKRFTGSESTRVEKSTIESRDKPAPPVCSVIDCVD